MMCGRDIFWHDYKRYGYSKEDFEDNVVADAEWEEVIEPMELPKKLKEIVVEVINKKDHL